MDIFWSLVICAFCAALLYGGKNMINAWHLAWIVPLSAMFGVFFMAILQVGDCDPDWYDDEM